MVLELERPALIAEQGPKGPIFLTQSHHPEIIRVLDPFTWLELLRLEGDRHLLTYRKFRTEIFFSELPNNTPQRYKRIVESLERPSPAMSANFDLAEIRSVPQPLRRQIEHFNPSYARVIVARASFNQLEQSWSISSTNQDTTLGDLAISGVFDRLSRSLNYLGEEGAPDSSLRKNKIGNNFSDASHLKEVWPDVDDPRSKEIFANVAKAEVQHKAKIEACKNQDD